MGLIFAECAVGGFTVAIKCASLGNEVVVGDLLRSLSLFSFKDAKSAMDLVCLLLSYSLSLHAVWREGSRCHQMCHEDESVIQTPDDSQN